MFHKPDPLNGHRDCGAHVEGVQVCESGNENVGPQRRAHVCGDPRTRWEKV